MCVVCVVRCSAHDWSRISQTRSDLIWPVIHFCLATYVLVRTTQFTLESRIYAYYEYKSLYAYIHTYELVLWIATLVRARMLLLF